MKRKSVVRLGALGAIVAVALTTAIAGPALADPAAGTFKPIVGTGSDTTQDVLNGLAGAIPDLGSYDATGSATIQVSAGGPTFNRPNGSTNGVKALTASVNAPGNLLWGGQTITGQLDFARSSSGPAAAGTDLTYIPFAKDAVTFAVLETSDFPRNIQLGTASDAPTKFTLRNIYKCTVTSFPNAAGDPVTIVPLIPQAGSGTRSFWQSQLGLSSEGFGPCVTDRSGAVQEHKGDALQAVGEIVPISIAQYIAQSNSGVTGVDDRRGFAELGRVNAAKPIVMSAGKPAMNGSFPVSRQVYNVVPTASLGDAQIAATFVGSGSAVCSNAAVIQSFGFATIGSACGSTTTKGAFINP
ncbi:substrate-binding domain-containing protein [Agromyces sp. Soil535]|uniref:substrate-binding domain-containing protein n=1 Tax=Agromyces sp. Soil535 TaxID=1736390 RepID=UPI000B2470C6|nr:substrate-binding domain-containing protein [Agromyces sp. Soil535]